MSKASKWAEAKPENLRTDTGVWATVTQQGDAEIGYRSGAIYLDAKEAVLLAKWLLHNFGEEND
jgi:hypothetical protein